MLGFFRDVSLRAKITGSFVLIVLCGTAISTMIGSRIITTAMRNEALKQVRHGLEAARMVYDARVEKVRKAVVDAARFEAISSAAFCCGLSAAPWAFCFGPSPFLS